MWSFTAEESFQQYYDRNAIKFCIFFFHFFSDDLTEYIEEIDMAWDLAMKVSGNTYKKVFFYGHSTGVRKIVLRIWIQQSKRTSDGDMWHLGGLIVSMYHRKGTYRSKIDGLVFNSPFFALNLPKIIRKAVSLKHSVVGLGKGIQPITTVGPWEEYFLKIVLNWNWIWPCAWITPPTRM